MHWTYAPGIEPFRPQLTRHAAAQARASLADRDAASIPVSAGVVRIWCEALAAFAAHSGPILALAVSGFGGVVLLGCLADLLTATRVWEPGGVVCRLSQWGWLAGATGPFLATGQATGVLGALSGGLCLYGWNPAVRLLAQAILGLAAMALARGAISAITLGHGASRTGCQMAELRAGLRAAFACWPSLLAGTALYALAASVCALGLFALQHELGLDQTHAGRPAEARAAIRRFASEAYIATTPDPGAPLGPVLSALRDVLSREDRAAVNWLAVHLGSGAAGVTLHAGAPSAGAWFAAACGAILMLLAELLLRFRSVAAVAAASDAEALPRSRGLLSCLSPLAQSARFGARHWRQVALHGMGLQAVSALVCVACIALPQTLGATIGIGSSGPCLLNPFLETLAAGTSTAAACLPALILAAFGAVYDARLYRALSSVNPAATRQE